MFSDSILLAIYTCAIYTAPHFLSCFLSKGFHMKNKSADKPKARGSVAMVVLPGSTRNAVPQAKLLKKSDPKTTIQVSIYLRRNPTPPGKSLSTLGDMNEQFPAQRHYANDEEFN